MDIIDDDLRRFDEAGPPKLPEGGVSGVVENAGARIWYAAWGEGPPVVLLHGGLGNAGNWGFQVPALITAGHRVVVIDSRGQGRSTRDDQPFSYALMGSDTLAVLERLGIETAAIVGWSDGAATGLVLARTHPTRVARLFYFACNAAPSGTLPFEMTPRIERCLSRHRKDWAALSPTPERFDALMAALQPMQAQQPNYGARELGEIAVPVTVAQAAGDEFIRRSHAEHIARSIAGAQYVLLEGVTHFAPVQRPALFNAAVLAFLDG